MQYPYNVRYAFVYRILKPNIIEFYLVKIWQHFMTSSFYFVFSYYFSIFLGFIFEVVI